jgi:hypothetical protein
LNIEHESLFIPPLPESREGLLPRCDKAMNFFNKKYPYSPRSAFVIVTHAAACIGMAKAAAILSIQEVTPAAPCGIYQLTRTNNTEKWQLDAHDKPGTRNGFIDHISDLGTSTKIWYVHVEDTNDLFLPVSVWHENLTSLALQKIVRNHFGDKKVNFGYTGPTNSRFAPAPTIESNEEL